MHYEDEKCIAFDDPSPVAKSHFVVLPKDSKTSFITQDEALIGHLMLVASKVAKTLKLEDGYRVVINNGDNGFETIPNLYLHVIGG